PPVVDDPADYGAIAATNALNDVFAMGGVPLLALSIAAFPEELPIEMLGEVFAAADAQVRAAGGLLAGGHTIRDAEPKYGLAVVGTVRPDGIWPKNGAKPGDALFLTKPLGTGLIMTGYKKRLAGEMQLERAIRWMRMLNKDAADVLRGVEPNAVTDVTGFGLFDDGHLEYLRGAAAQSDEVFVGITNPDPQRIKEEPSDPLRHLPESNPFTYVERLLMVKAVAVDEGIRAHVIPFPVNEPELWP